MKNIFKFSVIFSVVGILTGIVDAAQSPNPRSGNNNAKRTETTVSQDSGVQSRRAASSVIARSMKVRARNKVVTNGSIVSRSTAVRNKVSKPVSNINTARTATNSSKIVRSAMNMNKVRSATNPNNYGKRSARATAIYGDESKMGAGYASCKTAYATCMDQFCGKANETYRRCYCSDRFRDFRDIEDVLDSALSMLADFQNNNLDAVTKTAAEVGAMYSASEGEAAIKKDTSASQKLLDSIGDLLSGKKSSKKDSASKTSSNRLFDISSLNISSVSTSLDDIWGGGSSDGGLFANSSSATNDLTELDGKDLYNEVNQQCISVVRGSCENDAMFNLAKSSYSVLISQDCNLYEKQIDTKKKSVEDTVRTAEKYLREARLEEYRSHNSADVNECLDKVTKAILMETACGENYHKCLDYSGMYINLTTGEPIYSKALFGLNQIIVLNGSSDVLGANPKFNDFLETKQMFVKTALDSCRGIADTVWTEFKRSALIQIAQAQDEKLEEVKNSCVATMKECYDTQTGALNDFDDTTAQSSGAIAAVTARGMCYDKVMACAALYGDPNGCEYDDSAKTLKPVSGKTCGLQSLLAFVDTVDAVKIEEGCEQGLKKYTEELCAPASGDSEHKWPWGCRLMALGTEKDIENKTSNTVYGELSKYAERICAQDLVKADNSNTIGDNSSGTKQFSNNVRITSVIKSVVTDVKNNMNLMLEGECAAVQESGSEGNVIWDSTGFTVSDDNVVSVSTNWMKRVFGSERDLKSIANTGFTGYTLTVEATGQTYDTVSGEKSFGWGVCMIPTIRQLCNMQNQIPGQTDSTTYNQSQKTCDMNEKWFVSKCSSLGGYWKGETCYIK